MSFTEHQEYHPIVDELVFYVTQWHETAAEKAASNQEVQILLSFGLAFDVVDAKFWRIVKSLGEASLQAVKQDTLALMDTITYMKEAGILSNKAMRIVSELIHNLDALSAHQLVDFTLMYSSSEMQSAIDISEHISKLEMALLQHKNDFTIDSFAAICSVVSFDDSGKGSLDNFTINLPVFMHENLD